MSAACFDYVIVGAGSAGCVLANRLTASGRHRVLLLEAGGHDRNIWIHIPLGYGKLFTNRKVNWLYTSEPELELNNRRIIQPRGKVLGGSSSINGLLYIRGQPADFDHWRQLGNSGWSFEDVLPYFRRAEDKERGEDMLHWAGGALAVSDVANRIRCVGFFRRCTQGAFHATMTLPANLGGALFPADRPSGCRWSTGSIIAPGRAVGPISIASYVLPAKFLPIACTGVEYRQGERPALPMRTWKSSWRAARSTRHSSSSCPGSGPRRCCARSVSTWWRICRGSGPTCRITFRSVCNIAARIGSR